MKKRVLVLICMGWLSIWNAAAIRYPQYDGLPSSAAAYAVSDISIGESFSFSSHSAFGTSISADEWLTTQSTSGLAQTPYSDREQSNTSSARRAAKPGSGTGVIPNPTPMGDGLLVLLVLALCYGICIRKKLSRPS